MRFSPTEIGPSERDVARETPVVEQVVEPESARRLVISPAEGPERIPRGILEEELADVRAVAAVTGH